MSWFRDWLKPGKSAGNGQQEQHFEAHPERAQGGVPIRDAERRQLRRLLRRRNDLQFDLQRATQARESENQWNERIEQLNSAIEQAARDRDRIEPKPDEHVRPQLAALTVRFSSVREQEPAEVNIDVEGTQITYREEIDWAERGHQVTLPELRRVGGDVDSLLPGNLDPDVTRELQEHLRHSLATLANQALENAARGDNPPDVTLAELTAPCPDCGGWLDQKGRCPACAELDWERNRIDADLLRLRRERDDVIQELERYQERLPIIQRQLSETESDIQKLRDKGVEPAE